MPRIQELRATFDGRLCVILDTPTDDAGSVSIYTEAELEAVLQSARSSALEEAEKITITPELIERAAQELEQSIILQAAKDQINLDDVKNAISDMQRIHYREWMATVLSVVASEIASLKEKTP